MKVIDDPALITYLSEGIGTRFSEDSPYCAFIKGALAAQRVFSVVVAEPSVDSSRVRSVLEGSLAWFAEHFDEGAEAAVIISFHIDQDLASLECEFDLLLEVAQERGFTGGIFALPPGVTPRGPWEAIPFPFVVWRRMFIGDIKLFGDDAAAMRAYLGRFGALYEADHPATRPYRDLWKRAVRPTGAS